MNMRMKMDKESIRNVKNIIHLHPKNRTIKATLTLAKPFNAVNTLIPNLEKIQNSIMSRLSLLPSVTTQGHRIL